MFGTRFILDEEKIEREGIYDLEEMYRMIDEMAIKRAGLSKVAKGYYVFSGKRNAQAHLGILVFNCLLDCEWFTKNVKTWEWLGDSNNENYVENLIDFFQAKNEGVWA